MNILCIGGGPAGLHFALLMKRRDPAHRIRVIERGTAAEAPGWGVVLSDETLAVLAESDAELARRVAEAGIAWDRIDIRVKGRLISSGGHGFHGIARRALVAALRARAEELGVELIYGTEVADPAECGAADLIVAADGAHSRIRARHAAHFAPRIERRGNRYLWLGTTKRLDAFTFVFEPVGAGWAQIHAYPFGGDLGTVIVEMPESVWRAAGLAEADSAESLIWCEKTFAAWLGSARLLAAESLAWRRFPRVSAARWVKDNLVLLGDAAHTAHFSIGVGTRLALEDAAALADCLDRRRGDPARALADYESRRQIAVAKLQSAARNSTEWFENVARYARLPAEQFAHSLLTRSQRLGHATLRRRDAGYVEGVERWLGAGGDAAARPNHAPVPPMFLPFRLRGMTLANRVVVSPMAVYKAEDGVPGDFHLAHLGARALGGAGLLLTEMTAVTPEARITPGCPGLYRSDQTVAWTRILRFIHGESAARIGLQLGHAGPKGATRRGWEGMDQPLETGGWPLLGPSARPWRPGHAIPRAMTEADMARVIADFAHATERAAEAGFDLIELHAAHGYLLSAFISPLSNRRRDDYGGPLANRLRFPVAVLRAMRAVWPEDKPIAVRISACDWAPGGVTAAEAVEIARAFKEAGADLIDVSAGQTSIRARPVYGRMFQTPFSDRIRNEIGIATMAVGNITEADHVNTIIAAGRADLCALARPHLADPHFTLRAAAEQGYGGQFWPPPYKAGQEQLERLVARGNELPVAI